MTPALIVSNLAKGYGGVPVLRDVSMTADAGEVVGLVGENGAGKSTLMKIVTGQVRPDAGQVRIQDKLLEHVDPVHARSLGVGIVPQELAPYPELTVYENLFVGREIRSRLGILDRPEMARQARTFLEVFDVEIDPRTKMKHLSVALIQLVEIVKATTWGAMVLLLDEPTSAIPDREVDRLYAVVRRLRDQGVAIIYTTHRMAEIEALVDRVVVLRDGAVVLDGPLAANSEPEIVRAMIGRDLGTLFTEVVPPSDQVGLAVRGLRLERESPELNLSVAKGEILGLGGLVGAGRTEIVEAIFGIRHSVDGAVEIEGQPISRNSPEAAIRSGIALVPEDRKGAGLVLTRSILDNGSLPHLSSFCHAGWIRLAYRRESVRNAMESVELRARGLDQSVGTLSGGNQQKVVLARWLTRQAKVLLLDEPTRGVDVGARGEIYGIIRSLAMAGLVVVLVSSDMTELIGLSHRVLVIRGGAVAGELSRQELDAEDAQERIFRIASGQLASGGGAGRVA